MIDRAAEVTGSALSLGVGVDLNKIDVQAQLDHALSSVAGLYAEAAATREHLSGDLAARVGAGLKFTF